jgi:GT2 family glycosyltransferase
MKPKFSIIVPVYNRPDELLELLGSLSAQSFRDFELVVIEDGSQFSSAHLIPTYKDKFSLIYLEQENTGPAIARNNGMKAARGEYFLFIDSDCMAPADWLESLATALKAKPVDAFGGPDLAAPDFNLLQRAISFAMTSFLTTGGIRGGKKQIDRFYPRSFNMGIHRRIFEQLGGFPVTGMHPGEDMVFTIELIRKGFKTALFPDCGVYHKRRSNLVSFFRQVFKFGKTRYIISQVYPHTAKWIFWVPSALLAGLILMITLSILFSVWVLAPVFLYASLIFLTASLPHGCFKLGLLSLLTSAIQISAYGIGFISAVLKIKILKKDEYGVLKDGFYQKD